MEAAETASRPIESPRPVAAGRSPHLLAVVLALVIATVTAAAPPAADLYLSRSGPAPLRFAPAPAKSNDFAWLLLPHPVHALTNQTANAISAAAASGTNVVIVPDVAFPQTNSMAASVSENAASSPWLIPAISANPDANSLSASNLLLLTPQMLADFFKANLDRNYAPLTNGVGGVEIPFNPPSPKATPSSEAIYRTQ